MTDPLALLESLCEPNSHTFNPAGVELAGDVAARELAALGFEVERLAVPPAELIGRDGTRALRPLGRAIRATVGPEPRALMCIHLDTVHLPGSGFVVRTEGERLVGPGVVDAKGGLVVLLMAAAAHLASPAGGRLGLEVLLTPDEEVGSPSSAGLLAESAKRCVAGLVFEPSFPDGAIVAGRKGSGTYTIVVRGRSAHAGRDIAAGRNAVVAAARAATKLDAIALPGVTVNVGVFEGGTAPNVVPDVAVLRANVRVESAGAVAELGAAVMEAARWAEAYRDGITAEVSGGLSSPPRPLDGANRFLFEFAREAAAEAGVALAWRDSGGTCDGNKLAAAGLPTIDSLGPVGGELHSDREYVLPATLAPRARIAAGVLERVARWCAMSQG